MANKAELFQKVLAVDVAGGHQFLKIHEYSCYALAGATPVAMVAKQGMLTKLADLAFLFAIPVHSHYGMCACVTDYFPNKFKPYARGGVLGMSVITFLGLAKLNLFGPGITGTVKSLWGKPDKK